MDTRCLQVWNKCRRNSLLQKNARCLLTTWGEKGSSLNDYANRSWAGLTNGYYRPRWEEFIRDVYRALEQGKEFDQKLSIKDDRMGTGFCR